MESVTKKRKLNEIDTNVPFFPSSIPSADPSLGDAGKPIRKRLKQKKLITRSKGSENIQHNERDGEQTNTPKVSKTIKKDESFNKSIARCYVKSCDRSFTKKHIYDASMKDPMFDFKVDCVPPEVPEPELNHSFQGNTICEDEINDTRSYSSQSTAICEDDINVSHNYSSQSTVICGYETNVIHKYSTQSTTICRDTVIEYDAKELRIWFACDYFEEIVSYEFEKEKRFKLSSDYCKKYEIDPVRREILIDWLISVQVHLKAGNATLHLAVSLLDILLDRIYIPCERLQVSAIAAFWVAFKFIHGNLSVKALLDLCTGNDAKNAILDLEILVLESSRLLQTGGNMSTFFSYLLFKLFGPRFPPEIYYSGQYFLEIMIIHFVFIDSTACERAMTAVYMALSIFKPDIRSKLFEFSWFITKNQLIIMFRRLLKYLRAMYQDEEFLRASNVFRKYKTARYYKISINNSLQSFVM